MDDRKVVGLGSKLVLDGRQSRSMKVAEEPMEGYVCCCRIDESENRKE